MLKRRDFNFSLGKSRFNAPLRIGTSLRSKVLKFIIGKMRRMNTENVDLSIFYKDIALLRRCDKDRDNQLHILSIREFNQLFAMRQNDPEWRRIVYVQANVKAKMGIGRKINFLFLYDMYKEQNEENVSPNVSLAGSPRKGSPKNSPKRGQKPFESSNIDFLEKQIDDLSTICDEQQLCYQYCLRIGYYLQKVHGIDLLKMNCEFTVDDDGVMFFTYAFNIFIRRNNYQQVRNSIKIGRLFK
jgi:hypothetical protein